MHNLKSRRLVFATFFGNLLICGLLLISLTTNHWVRSSARRLEIHDEEMKSNGEIYYGLFNGIKDLNVAYGVRSNPVNVYNLITTEPDIMNYWLWFFTSLGVGFALFASAISAILSVIKSASRNKENFTMILLFISTSSSCISHIIAFLCWVLQFYMHLRYNLLSNEDRSSLHWYTNGLAYLGYSFWLIIISTLIVITNIILLIIAHKHDKWQKHRTEVPSEEKNQIAIMLY